MTAEVEMLADENIEDHRDLWNSVLFLTLQHLRHYLSLPMA